MPCCVDRSIRAFPTFANSIVYSILPTCRDAEPVSVSPTRTCNRFPPYRTCALVQAAKDIENDGSRALRPPQLRCAALHCTGTARFSTAHDDASGTRVATPAAARSPGPGSRVFRRHFARATGNTIWVRPPCGRTYAASRHAGPRRVWGKSGGGTHGCGGTMPF